MSRTLAVAWKELRQVARDRRTLMILLFIPAFFLLLYGYALNFDIRHIGLAVEDRDGTARSRDLVAAFVNSGYFDLLATVESPSELDRLMDRGIIRAALVIPEGFARQVESGETADVQVLVNGDNANTASTVMGYALAISGELSARYRFESRQVRGRAAVVAEPRIWWNPELRSTLFLVPGLIAYIMMITAVVSTALSVVREKERGTMEQIRMAPIRPIAFVLGKTVPYFGISMISAVLIVIASMALFDLPVRGSWTMLLLALALFVIGALGTGLLISTLADSQQVAFQVSLLVAFLPTLMLSGFIFPISSMPFFVQAMTYVVPARYFLTALREILLKGVGLPLFWPEFLALACYATAVVTLASVRLSREWR
jgi:ABC-2 type transport system permease protein